MIARRKEGNVGRAITRRGKAKVAFTAGRGLGDSGNRFGSRERGFVMDTASERANHDTEIDIVRFLDQLHRPRREFRIVPIIGNHRPDVEEHIFGRHRAIQRLEVSERFAARTTCQVIWQRLRRDAESLHFIARRHEFLFRSLEKLDR